ncbi:MAG: tRNA (adenosine(37)-N6)-dimethylallyltransferase MiaA [Clostridia bacterium]|nr:tRNA (adenosine(37)-N6)-dimethylallyltransferase MiaA [Clostridia bacterium]
MADKVKLLVIAGATATGKTSLSVELAKRLDGEVICADSMQIYDKLLVGTARPTSGEMQGIPHHLMGFLAPEKRFSVAEYVELASKCIDEISSRGKQPIITGGTGLYIQSLTDGVKFTQQDTDLSVREALSAETNEQLYERLLKLDAEYAKTLHPNNRKRVMRAVELYIQTGTTMTQQLANSVPTERPYDDYIAVLDYETRDALYDNINKRVDVMLKNGLLNEAKLVLENRESYVTAAQAIGYKEFFPYFENEQSLEQCTEKLKQATRNYAKRQLTWFNRMKNAMHYKAACAQTSELIYNDFIK